MKKFWSKLKQNWRSWAYMLLVLCLAVSFFTNDFGLVDIHKMAIVAAVGIDEEQGEVQVTAQIAVPVAAENGDTGAHTQVTGKGRSVAEAFDDINTQTGFLPKLHYCKVIVLGESCQSRSVFDALDYFYRNENALLTTKVAMCAGSASALLSLQTPLSTMTALMLENLLSDVAVHSGNVTAVNLKDLYLHHLSQGKTCFLPYVEFMPEPQTTATSTQPQGEQSPQVSSFRCSRSAVFLNGEFVGILSEDAVRLVCLAHYAVRTMRTEVSTPQGNVGVSFRQSRLNISADIQGGAPCCRLSLATLVKVQDTDGAHSPRLQAQSELPPKDVLLAVKQKLTDDLNALITFCKQTNADLFGVKQRLYRTHNAWASKNQYPVSQISFFVTVTADAAK